MALPAAVTTVPLHGRILKANAAGTPATGTVSFRIEQTLRDTTDKVLLAPTTITTTLDATGAFTVSLPATDDPDVTPRGWTYVVTIVTDAWHDTFRIAIPVASVGTLELANIAPAIAPSTLVTYILASTMGLRGGPAGPLDTNGLIPAAQIPGGGPSAAATVTAETSYGVTPAAGSASTYSKGDHTHGTPANPVDNLSQLRAAMTPAGRTETRSRLDSGTNAVITSGTLYLVPTYLTAGQSVSSISFVSGSTALAAGTNKWFGLLDSARLLLAATADDTSNAWAANSAKTLSIAAVAAGPAASFTATYSGLHFLSLSVSATTMPTITSGTTANASLAAASPAWGASPTSQATPPAFPFQPAAPTSAGPSAYAWTA
jgi:hypothetical protein